ncbi:hypothetical protein JWJ90_13545 [Desulfobulbus rhabdoformis]|uniref:hypothetical protein n=1 Tax=Desulfobulbus rhabdoformis TaxID=34032 RepID=UPI0019645587|nr:hypothetical protein [Desulfobulbus rhabdoformis]MBM9615303.1 hypothetical protein [Desulfobulbus rhabdoformis]
MAVTWPLTLPAPLRTNLTITPVPDVRARTLQSGRKELRRWGSGGGDTLTCVFRLLHNHLTHGDQVASFENLWDRELNFGLNWIDADWLPLLGYNDHYCRITGYSPVQGKGIIYTDYSVTFAIQKSAKTWPDTLWPIEGPGGSGSGDTGQEGLVVGFGTAATTIYGVSNVPSELYATKVEISPDGKFGCALRANGTLSMWGSSETTVNTYFPGWDSLSGIADFALTNGPLIYVTTSGTVGVLGLYMGQVGAPPIVSNAVSVCGERFNLSNTCYWAIVFLEDGNWEFWGNHNYTTRNMGSNFPLSTGSAGRMWGAFVDTNGNVGVAGATSMTTSPTPAELAAISGAVCAVAGQNWYAAYKSDGTWAENTTFVTLFGDKPAGLVPTDLMMAGANAYMCALHTDGTPVAWAGSSYATGLANFEANIPEDLKLHQMSASGYSTSVLAAVGIQRED